MTLELGETSTENILERASELRRDDINEKCKLRSLHGVVDQTLMLNVGG